MQSQGKGTSTARGRRAVLQGVLAILATLGLGPRIAVAEEAPRCAFTDGQLAITVAAEAAAEGAGSDLQITVSGRERLVTRLAATLPGFLEQCWKTDLDANGHFEIVVASTLAGEGARVNVYEWRGTRFEPLKLAAVDAALLPAAAQAERYYVTDAVLYGRFRTGPADAEGTTASRHVTLRYVAASRRWEPASASAPPPR